MKKENIIKIIVFCIYATSIIRPVDCLLGIDYFLGYIASFIFESIFELVFGPIVKPLLEYTFIGAPAIVRDALVLGTPILNLKLFGENGAMLAYDILSALVGAIFSGIWGLTYGVGNIIATLTTGNYNGWLDKILNLFGLFGVGRSLITSAAPTEGRMLSSSSNANVLPILFKLNKNNEALFTSQNENTLNDCFLRVICSLHIYDDELLLPNEQQMKMDLQTWLEMSSATEIDEVVRASAYGRREMTEDSCNTFYSKCAAPAWLLRPILAGINRRKNMF